MQARGQPVSGIAAAQQERRYDIDWLRTLAVLMLFIFHAARIFDIYEPFYAKNKEVSAALTHIIVDTIAPWFMPLFFLLAGASTWFALGFRSGGEYARERFRRLLIPFIFGMLLLIPPQPYYGLLTHSDYAGSFLKYYPDFFRIIPQDLDGYYLGGFTMGHLWFIFYLFVFSLLVLPLFLYLRSESGKGVINRLAAITTRPGMIFLLALLPMIMFRLLDFKPNPLYYSTFFIYGYVLAGDERFWEAIDRHKAVALVLGVSYHLYIQVIKYVLPLEMPDWLIAIHKILYGFVPWLILIAILGYGKRYLNFSNGFLRYIAEASYPFYILHQTVIIVIGFYVVQWNTHLLFKYIVIVIASLVATAILYDLMVKRINVMRFFFGMKPKG
jgi:glucan biosynthesis protein C